MAGSAWRPCAAGIGIGSLPASSHSAPTSAGEAPGRDDTTEVLGQTDAGPLLLVVVTEASDGRDSVVTARDMITKERRTFRERSR
ncbi:MAG: hypothetical protein ACRDYD_04365 [Acidimicrobiales bacterium]